MYHSFLIHSSANGHGHQVWNRSPAQVGCMRQVLRAGALGRPRGMGWVGRQKGGSGWGTHVNPWLIHVNVWKKPLQYCKVISFQLIKISGKKGYQNSPYPTSFLSTHPMDDFICSMVLKMIYGLMTLRSLSWHRTCISKCLPKTFWISSWYFKLNTTKSPIPHLLFLKSLQSH